MHAAFRTIGQQVGIQLIRGILPESIDVYINDVITEKIKQELFVGVRTALQDNVNTQAMTMSPINLFRTLYRTARFSIDVAGTNGRIGEYVAANGFHVINIPTVNSGINVAVNEYLINPMMYLGFSIEYANTLRGNAIACRLIGSDVLETTLRDYCNGASKDSPIVVLNSIPAIMNGKESLTDISNEQLEIYLNCKDCKVTYLNVKYVKVPNVVKYDIDLNKCVNCDLPEYTHFEIVERAVNKFYQSTNGNSVQQPQQERQRQ